MEKFKPIAASWGRSFATAALTCYMTYGLVSWKIVINAGMAAVIPVILRWLNPNDKAFGRSK
jgi:hypothetical protein